MTNPEVLIAGAGPTGLVLALWLNKLGIRIRIVDKLAEPGTTSRALVVHARTLEFYRQIGLDQAVVQQGVRFIAANLWVKNRLAGHVGFGAMGEGLSLFPYMLVFPQDEHERLLIDELARAGVAVERPTELLGFSEEGDHIVARLRGADGVEETCRAAYIAGCDGTHSTVRHTLDVDFPGGAYSRLFYVADVAATGPVMNGELHVALDDVDFLAVFPLKQPGHARLIGTIHEEAIRDQAAFGWNDVSKTVLDRLGVGVEQVNWFSTYRVHHRVAERFRQGRAFLCGDAAHIHSPVGGQGMNTGIGDAVNLAWKLAGVIRDRAAPSLLDSYEPERIAFARRLVNSTDRAFTFVTSTGRFARFVRVFVAPRLLPALFKLKAVRRFMFRTVSQIAIQYRDSPLSAGAAADLKGGDRLPWVPAKPFSKEGSDNFEPLESLDWQVHVYGECPPAVTEFCLARHLPLHVFPHTPAAARAGLPLNAIFIIRPDGYIALADPAASVATLELYIAKHELRFTH